MPELPEVETVKEGLKQNIINKTISSVNISNKNLRFAYPDNFTQDLISTTVKDIRRRARYLFIELSNKKFL